MRIHCCDTIVWVETREDSHHEVTPQQALLLRLLLLWPRWRVSHDLACHVLRIQRSGIGTYVGKLRSELGDEASVKSERGFLTLVWDRDDTDVAEFRRLVSTAQRLADDRGFDALDADAAREIMRVLSQALDMWHGSPATGLDAALQRRPDARRAQDVNRLREDLADLEAVFDDWLDLWTEARLLRSDCLLAQGLGREQAKLAMADLMTFARSQDPPDEVWPRLFTATLKAQDRRRQRQAWELCQRAFERNREEMPPDLQRYAPRPDAGIQPDVPAAAQRPVPRPAADWHPQTASDGDPRLPLIDLLGITSASALQLRGSRLEPSDCIERTTRRLYVSGVLAGKWVAEADVQASLESLLNRLDTQDSPGDVRFMVIDPASAAYRRLEQMRGGGTNVESVNRLVRLARRFQCLEVRGISHLPAFRLIVIDEDIVSFSPYALAEEAYRTSRVGWAAPHVVLDPLAPWPLAAAFRLYYEETWRTARPLSEEF